MSTLYLEHFGLAEAPFSITPNPHFFFAGSNRGSLLDALKFSVQSDEGIVTVIGEVGSGKTMLCRMLLDDLPPQVDAVYLANPSFSANEILDAIAHDLGVSQPAGSAMTRLDALNRELIARYAAGRRVVLLIDEAHAMPPESLEEVRLLSNLETSRHKLVGIVLFGQPELAEVLARPSMRQLRERVVQRFELGPLHPGELRDYLEFRLRAAGHRGNFPFTPKAVARIGRVSGGLTRRINILADKALLSAFARNGRGVELEDARRAERDVGFTAGARALPRRRLALAAGIAALGIGAAFAAGVWMGRSGTGRDDAGPPARPMTTTTTARAPANPGAAAAPQASAPANAAPPQAPGDIGGPDRAQGTPASPPAPATETETETTLHGAEQALSRWRASPARGYTLQVAAFRDADGPSSDDAIARIARSVPRLPVAALREGQGRTPRVLVFVGHFPSAAVARRAIDRLPAPLRANRPVPRPLDGLPPADRT
ncbi:MAG: AAA family ATPase [Pseudomonadota bacterium]